MPPSLNVIRSSAINHILRFFYEHKAFFASSITIVFNRAKPVRANNFFGTVASASIPCPLIIRFHRTRISVFWLHFIICFAHFMTFAASAF
ncbi:hypothetical protein CW304_29755 [Bacillus sp. UFRGS-B20]|nr:hypothetical protein CW304_29755 [Bacillus sp. UFRGS-B20]